MSNILKNLQSPSFCLRLRGIFECVAQRNLDTEEKVALMALLDDNFKVDVRCVCDFAAAALDFLGICKYVGNNPDVFKIIEEMPYIPQSYLKWREENGERIEHANEGSDWL